MLYEKTEVYKMGRKTEMITACSEALAALTIIISGGTFVADKLYYSKQVDVSASLVASSTKNLSLLMSNDGQIDVAIKQVTIEVPGYGVTNAVELETGGELLPKNSSKLLKSQPSFLNSSVIADEREKNSNLPSISKTNCDIKIRYVVAKDNSIKEIPLNLKCYAASFVDPEELNNRALTPKK